MQKFHICLLNIFEDLGVKWLHPWTQMRAWPQTLIHHDCTRNSSSKKITGYN